MSNDAYFKIDELQKDIYGLYQIPDDVVIYLTQDQVNNIRTQLSNATRAQGKIKDKYLSTYVVIEGDSVRFQKGDLYDNDKYCALDSSSTSLGDLNMFPQVNDANKLTKTDIDYHPETPLPDSRDFQKKLKKWLPTGTGEKEGNIRCNLITIKDYNDIILGIVRSSGSVHNDWAYALTGTDSGREKNSKILDLHDRRIDDPNVPLTVKGGVNVGDPDNAADRKKLSVFGETELQDGTTMGRLLDTHGEQQPEEFGHLIPNHGQYPKVYVNRGEDRFNSENWDETEDPNHPYYGTGFGTIEAYKEIVSHTTVNADRGIIIEDGVGDDKDKEIIHTYTNGKNHFDPTGEPTHQTNGFGLSIHHDAAKIQGHTYIQEEGAANRFFKEGNTIYRLDASAEDLQNNKVNFVEFTDIRENCQFCQPNVKEPSNDWQYVHYCTKKNNDIEPVVDKWYGHLYYEGTLPLKGKEGWLYKCSDGKYYYKNDCFHKIAAYYNIPADTIYQLFNSKGEPIQVDGKYYILDESLSQKSKEYPFDGEYSYDINDLEGDKDKFPVVYYVPDMSIIDGQQTLTYTANIRVRPQTNKVYKTKADTSYTENNSVYGLVKPGTYNGNNYFYWNGTNYIEITDTRSDYNPTQDYGALTIGTRKNSNVAGNGEQDNDSIGRNSLEVGTLNEVTSNNAAAIGNANDVVGNNAAAIGNANDAVGNNAFAQGKDNIASGVSSHAEGELTTASSIDSHAEGYGTTAAGLFSHIEGLGQFDANVYTGTPGDNQKIYIGESTPKTSIVSGVASHAEGFGQQVEGQYNHAEGYSNTIIDNSNTGLEFVKGSHVEGKENDIIDAPLSHAEGRFNQIKSDKTQQEEKFKVVEAGHVEGAGNIVDRRFQHLEGVLARTTHQVGTYIKDDNQDPEKPVVFAIGDGDSELSRIRFSEKVSKEERELIDTGKGIEALKNNRDKKQGTHGQFYENKNLFAVTEDGDTYVAGHLEVDGTSDLSKRVTIGDDVTSGDDALHVLERSQLDEQVTIERDPVAEAGHLEEALDTQMGWNSQNPPSTRSLKVKGQSLFGDTLIIGAAGERGVGNNSGTGTFWANLDESDPLNVKSRFNGLYVHGEIHNERIPQELYTSMVITGEDKPVLNEFADKFFVNSSIATSTATFRGSFTAIDYAPHQLVPFTPENNREYEIVTCEHNLPTKYTNQTIYVDSDKKPTIFYLANDWTVTLDIHPYQLGPITAGYYKFQYKNNTNDTYRYWKTHIEFIECEELPTENIDDTQIYHELASEKYYKYNTVNTEWIEVGADVDTLPIIDQEHPVLNYYYYDTVKTKFYNVRLITEVSALDTTEESEKTAWLFNIMAEDFVERVIKQDHIFNTFVDLENYFSGSTEPDNKIYYVINEQNFYIFEDSNWKKVEPIADNNDYCYLQIWDKKVPEPYVLFAEKFKDNDDLIEGSGTSTDAQETEAEMEIICERYKFCEILSPTTGEVLAAEWKFEYQLNNSGFTQAQWAAINSGISGAWMNKTEIDVNWVKNYAININKTLSKKIDDEIGDRERADKALSDRIDNCVTLTTRQDGTVVGATEYPAITGKKKFTNSDGIGINNSWLTGGAANKTFSLPSILPLGDSGELALDSYVTAVFNKCENLDIEVHNYFAKKADLNSYALRSALDDYVTIDSNQAITGKKNFTYNNGIGINGAYLKIGNNNNTPNQQTFTLPSSGNGELALKSYIDNGFVTIGTNNNTVQEVLGYKNFTNDNGIGIKGAKLQSGGNAATFTLPATGSGELALKSQIDKILTKTAVLRYECESSDGDYVPVNYTLVNTSENNYLLTGSLSFQLVNNYSFRKSANINFSNIITANQEVGTVIGTPIINYSTTAESIQGFKFNQDNNKKLEWTQAVSDWTGRKVMFVSFEIQFSIPQ